MQIVILFVLIIVFIFVLDKTICLFAKDKIDIGRYIDENGHPKRGKSKKC